MAEEDQTLGAVVQMVMEALSDSVSQLVLLVVSLAEQNAPLPPAVPPAAVGVAGAANTLTQVVRSLAEEEYRDFEEIQQQIITAADDTDNAATGLITAVEVIKTSADRKFGWNGLVEACRVISGNTIRVLQIVYGAQLKRLMQVASQVSSLLDSINTALLATDPQQFADHMSATVGKIGDLGVYTSEKALDEESPINRQQLTEAGEGFTGRSDELLASTNELLQSPNDAAAMQRFQELVQATKDIISAIMPIVQEQAAQLAATEGGNAEYSYQETADESWESAPLIYSSLHEALLAAEKHLGRFATAVAHSDPDEIADSLKQFSAAASEVGEYCTRSGNPTAQANSGRINELLPELVMLSRQILGQEEAHEVRAQISDIVSQIHEALDAIAAACVEPQYRMEEVVARQLGFLQTLSASASVRSAQGVVTNLKQIAATQAKLLPLMSEYANGNEELEQAIADLEALLPQHVTSAKAFLQDTSNIQAQQRLYSVIDTMKAPLTGVRANLDPSTYKVVEALEAKQSANAVQLRSAASGPAVIQASQAIYSTSMGLARQAQRVADMYVTDQRTQAQLLRSIDAMQGLMEAQAAAQEELERDPNNADARVRLNNASEALLASAAALAGELHDVDVVQQTLRSAVERKDASGVESALAELDECIEETVNLVRAVGGGDQDEWLQSSLAALDEAVKEQRNAARAAVTTGDLDALQEPMEVVANQLAALRTHCAQQISGKPSDVQIATQALDTCNKAIDQLETACKEGDGNNAASAARALVDSSALATRHAKEAESTMDAAAKERTEQALAHVDEKIPALLRATKAALSDDTPDTVALALAAEDARHALGELAHAVAVPAEELLLTAQQTHRARTRTLRDTVAAKHAGKASDKEVAEALHATVESAKEVRDALKAIAHDNHDSTHLAEKVDRHLGALIACDRAAREGRTQGTANAVYHAEQIEEETAAVTRSMAPGLVSEAKQMESALERLSNLLADPNAPLDPAKINKAITDLVAHERAMEAQLKVASATIPPQTYAMATTLTNALREEVLGRAVAASFALAQDPHNASARLAALSAVAEVRSVATRLTSAFQNVHANEGQKQKEAQEVERAVVVHAADAAQSVNEMIPDLVRIVAVLSANPSSSEAQGKLAAAIDAIEGNISNFVQAAEYHESAPPAPASPLADDCAATLAHLGKMAQGTSRNDATAVVEAVKALAQDLPKLIEQVNALNAQDPNSPENRAMRDVAAELATQLPANVEQAKAFIKNTKSEPAKKELLRSTWAMSDNVQQLRTLAKPTPSTQVKNLSDRVSHQSQELAKLTAARNKAGVTRALLDIKKTANELRDEAQKLEDQYIDPARRMRVAAAIADLENRLKEKQAGGATDLEHAATALADDPTNKNKQMRFDETLQYFQNACTGVTRAANASIPAKAQKENQHVQSMARAARSGDPQGVVAFAREAAATQVQLIEEAKAEAKNNKVNREKVDAAAANLEKNLSQAVMAAKGVLQDPANPAAQTKLAASVLQLSAPLAELSAVASPSPLADVEAAASDEASQLMALAAQPDAAQREKVKESHKHLTEAVKKELADPRLPPATGEVMVQQLAELDKTIASIEAFVAAGEADKLASACLAAQTPLTRIADAAHTTTLLPPPAEAPPAVNNAVEKAKTLLAVLRNARAGKADMSVIMNSSQHLARTLSDLVGLAKTQAYMARGSGTLSETAERALALDELLTSLANLGTPSAGPAAATTSAITINMSMDSLISSIGNEELATVPPPAPPQIEIPVPQELPKVPSTKKKAAAKKKEGAPSTPPAKMTLDESLKQVANEIRAAPVTATPTGAPSAATTSSHSLATELERLAGAAQSNKRQDVLVCGRSIAALVSQICEQLRVTAKESTTPLVQDKLLKSSQALKNYAIQLKILASVKAASTSLLDHDADEQLSTMTRALGTVLGEGLKAIDIHYKTMKKAK